MNSKEALKELKENAQEQWYAKVNKMLEKYERENKDE